MNSKNIKILSACLFMASSKFSLAATSSFPSLENNPSFEKISIGATFLCEGTKSVGFNWNDGKWEYKSFKSEKWIVKKIDKHSKFCNLKDSTDDYYDYDGKKTSNLQRCYAIKRFGEKTDIENFINVNVCFESYQDGYSEGVAIQCPKHFFNNFSFTPNGAFFIQSSSPFIPPKNSKPDSQFMESGLCSSM